MIYGEISLNKDNTKYLSSTKGLFDKNLDFKTESVLFLNLKDSEVENLILFFGEKSKICNFEVKTFFDTQAEEHWLFNKSEIIKLDVVGNRYEKMKITFKFENYYYQNTFLIQNGL